jgi:hypothetical protein
LLISIGIFTYCTKLMSRSSSTLSLNLGWRRCVGLLFRNTYGYPVVSCHGGSQPDASRPACLTNLRWRCQRPQQRNQLRDIGPPSHQRHTAEAATAERVASQGCRVLPIFSLVFPSLFIPNGVQ